MSRDFFINGETMVKVKGGYHLIETFPESGILWQRTDLGLASDSIRISPVFRTKDIKVDAFGPQVPAEIMTQIAEVNISMTLIHYDPSVLDACMAESHGGVTGKVGLGGNVRGFQAGALTPAGAMLGRGRRPLQSGCHFISLNLISTKIPSSDFTHVYPWRFPTSYLATPPMEFPIGTERTGVILNWRAIPYVCPFASGTVLSGYSEGSNLEQPQEITSSGLVLWDHQEDEVN